MTTITTDMLRSIAHALGASVDYTRQVISSEFDTEFDDTPADTDDDLCTGCYGSGYDSNREARCHCQPADETEQTMGMTITQEQFEQVVASSGVPAEKVREIYDGTGITITPAEPPAEMVKLAREIAERTPGLDDDYDARKRAAFVTLQHVVDVVKGARHIRAIQSDYIERELILNALGAGGRDAG